MRTSKMLKTNSFLQKVDPVRVSRSCIIKYNKIYKYLNQWLMNYKTYILAKQKRPLKKRKLETS